MLRRSKLRNVSVVTFFVTIVSYLNAPNYATEVFILSGFTGSPVRDSGWLDAGCLSTDCNRSDTGEQQLVRSPRWCCCCNIYNRRRRTGWPTQFTCNLGGITRVELLLHIFTGFTVLGEQIFFANGKSGCRHRTVSSASPCDRLGHRLRVPGGADMDRGESRSTNRVQILP